MSESEWLIYFSDCLYDIMVERKISQRELAERTGLSDGTISKYINGVQIPKFTAAINIAMALDCTLEELGCFGEMIYN